MTTRFFIKCLGLLSFGLFIPAECTKRYITRCKWDEVVGLRFEWLDSKVCPNPFPGKDWEIFYREPRWFDFEGGWISNYRLDKFRTRPIGISNYYKLFCFNCVLEKTDQGLHIEHGTVDLVGPFKFYRV